MIEKSSCIGCQACADICPVNAIIFKYDIWGEGKAETKSELCVNCGLCDKICPNNTINLYPEQDKVYAIVSNKNHHTGSSGGVFYELASNFINDGGVVFGAAFDENLKLIHKKAVHPEELTKLCKSKYIHSDMSGVYKEIKECLKNGHKVMFVGTPCQVSAVKNIFSDKYSENILLVDFLCHGTGTQKVFDICVRSEEKKLGGKITNFQFRAKTRKAEHSFKYKLTKDGKAKNISGYAFEFPYYYSYLKYTIFSDYCYSCKYAQKQRVGDITLGDFWKIQNYNKKLRDKNGVSMICINSQKGREFFEQIEKKCSIYEYPLEYCSENNEAFNKPVDFPKRKKELINILSLKGEEELVKEMSCKKIRKQIIYANTPKFVKNFYDRLRGRK